jgi:hypothetical protein
VASEFVYPRAALMTDVGAGAGADIAVDTKGEVEVEVLESM